MARLTNRAMTAKEAYDANDRKIEARLDRLNLLTRELEDGEAFVAAWAERRARLQAEIADNQEKYERYMDRIPGLNKAMAHELDVKTVHELEAKIAKLKRDIEHGGKVVKAKRHEPPTMDYFG